MSTPECSTSETTFHRVACSSCGISTAPFEEYEDAIDAAMKLGFEAVATPEDGVLNFCVLCREPKPIDMIIFCPVCHTQHVDEPNPEVCMDCGHNEDIHGDIATCNAEDAQGDQCPCIRFNPWTNPPHKSHRCEHCNTVFRIAEVPTNGVKDIEMKGDNDTWAIHVQSTGA